MLKSLRWKPPVGLRFILSHRPSYIMASLSHCIRHSLVTSPHYLVHLHSVFLAGLELMHPYLQRAGLKGICHHALPPSLRLTPPYTFVSCVGLSKRSLDSMWEKKKWDLCVSESGLFHFMIFSASHFPTSDMIHCLSHTRHSSYPFIQCHCKHGGTDCSGGIGSCVACWFGVCST